MLEKESPMSLKKFIPAPVKNVLRPYKEKIKRAQMVISLAANRKNKTPDGALQQKMRAFSEKYGERYLAAMLERGWCDPGHMFDELGEIFSVNNKLFFIGTNADAERLTKKLSFIGVEIESLSIDHPTPFDMKWVANHAAAGYTVIIGYEDTELANILLNMICNHGKHYPNINIFLESDFIGGYVTGPDVYCGIFAIYTAGKVYLPHNNVLVTTICNLNCEHCLNFTPYNKHPRHFTIDEIKESLDIYFTHIDRVGLFQLSGGEPLLYPHLTEILKYIVDKYEDKIGILNLVTNGTVVPDDSFLEFCVANNIFIYLDDYTAQVPQIKNKFSQTERMFEEIGVEYCKLQVPEFFISFPPKRANLHLNDAQLKQKFKKCYIGVQNVRDGKLCSCTYHAFAVNAGLIPDAPENWFDMKTMTNSILDKKKLVEFRLRFNKKGYVDWCRYCNGHISINPMRAPAAQQAKGILEWDSNSPTFID